MKFDVDTFIRVDSVMKEVNKIPSGNSLYIGNINYYHKPLRSGKWVVTYELIHGGRDARVHVVWQIPSLCSCLRRDGVDLGGDGGDAILYNTLIDGYTKEGDLEEVMKAFSQMRETKINPNVISFSSLIDAHCKRGNMEMAMGVYTEKVVRGLEPDVVAYTALVDGHAKAGNLEVAFMMHKEMVESGVVTNAFTLSCLVDGLFKNWRTRDAVSLFLERTGAKDFGKVTIFVRLIPDCPLVLPNSVSYMAMIYGLYRDGQHFKAGRFYYMMREAGLVPDIQT